MRIYFDMCSLQRPLDDQTQLRVLVKTQAVLGILALCESGAVDLIASDALIFETEANPDVVRRDYAAQVITKATEFVQSTDCGASKMTTHMRPLNEINHQAIRLLSEQIGIVDTVRFMNQFTTGHGNYTDERDALFGHLTLDDIVTAIENKRGKQTPNKSLNPTPTSSAN